MNEVCFKNRNQVKFEYDFYKYLIVIMIFYDVV